jgi:hypothetical protein
VKHGSDTKVRRPRWVRTRSFLRDCWRRVFGWPAITTQRAVDTFREQLIGERVHLPVCPECERIMKPRPGGEWKCCGSAYASTRSALAAYGQAVGERDCIGCGHEHDSSRRHCRDCDEKYSGWCPA